MKKCKLLNRQSGWDAKIFSDGYNLKGNKSIIISPIDSSQLRDPAIFGENGQLYLLYTG